MAIPKWATGYFTGYTKMGNRDIHIEFELYQNGITSEIIRRVRLYQNGLDILYIATCLAKRAFPGQDTREQKKSAQHFPKRKKTRNHKPQRRMLHPCYAFCYTRDTPFDTQVKHHQP